MAVSAAPVNDVVDRLENAGPLDPVVNAVRSIVSKALGPQKVRDALHGVWLGHPLHPVLTDVPIGMWSAAAVLDLMPGTGPGPSVLIASGVAAAVPTAVTGWADWSQLHKPHQRVGVVHAVANIVGLVPYTFTVTSHIIITVSLALLVFLTVIVYGFAHNGLRFFKLFVPSGVPIYILPLVVFIEVFSFFLRPLSHSVRLFANMLAGHIALKVFASFIPLLAAGLGIIGWVGGVLPLGMVIALSALELLVAFLQAYVFAILTCIYLNDAIHPGH